MTDVCTHDIISANNKKHLQEDNMYIGEMIRQYRERKEITQKDLAEELNVTPQAVSRWENGVSHS